MRSVARPGGSDGETKIRYHWKQCLSVCHRTSHSCSRLRSADVGGQAQGSGIASADGDAVGADRDAGRSRWFDRELIGYIPGRGVWGHPAAVSGNTDIEGYWPCRL